MEKKGLEKRNLGLEWLRICSMFMIILFHSIDHSGSYEIHANVCTEVMWQRLGMCNNNILQWWFPIYQLAIGGVIFLICSLIDYCRQRLFVVMKVDSFSTKIEMKVKRRLMYEDFGY